jgi:hypothetical protein
MNFREHGGPLSNRRAVCACVEFRGVGEFAAREGDGWPSPVTDSVTRDFVVRRRHEARNFRPCARRWSKRHPCRGHFFGETLIVRGIVDRSKGARGWRPQAIEIAVVAAALSGGCARTIGASTHVPNPLVVAAVGGTSEVTYDVGVLIKDLKQPEGLAHPGANQAGVNYRGRGGMIPEYIPGRYFPQAATIQYARPDEIHVAVLLTSEWKELTRLEGFQMELSDDRGTTISVTDAWMRSESHRDYEATYQSIKKVQTVRFHEGALSDQHEVWAPEESYVSERVYRGRATLVFHKADLLRRDTRWLTLTLRSRARTLRFTWYFDAPLRT